MRDQLKNIPNQLTAARLVLIPILWAMAFLKLPILIGIGTLLSFITDVLDGYIARRLNQVSDFGSKFDSLADNLLLPSALVWLWLFRPEIYRENIIACIIAVVVYFSSLFLGILKFRRFANLHLYFSKIASVFMCLFLVHALLSKTYNPVLFYIALLMFLISSLEGFLLQLISPQVDEHMGSILFVLKNRNFG